MHEFAFPEPDHEGERYQIACPWCAKRMRLRAIDPVDAPEVPSGLVLMCEHRPDQHVIRLDVSSKGRLP